MKEKEANELIKTIEEQLKQTTEEMKKMELTIADLEKQEKEYSSTDL